MLGLGANESPLSSTNLYVLWCEPVCCQVVYFSG